MDEPTEALEHRLLELTGIVLADATLEAALGHVARVTVRAIPACDAAGLSVLEHGRITTAAASVPLVHRLDAHQSAVEEGPCLDAIRTGAIELCEGETGKDYPAYGYAEQAWEEGTAAQIIANQYARTNA